SRSKPQVLKEKKIHQIQTIFNLLDSKDTGTINFAQFRAGLRALELEMKETDSKRLFETLDDGHGVEVEEFTEQYMREAIMRRLANNDPTQLTAEIRNVFNLFDDDGSGELEAQEIMAAFRRLGLEITMEEAQEMVDEADADGNGE
ncbi:hypothetical protein GUITHDRAFT_60792, partial [Guillardia theta CCMP2712]